MEAAIRRFDEFLDTIPTELYPRFRKRAIEKLNQRFPFTEAQKVVRDEVKEIRMQAIIMRLRSKFTFSGCAPDEQFTPPTTGELSEVDALNTVVVDSFLYDEEDMQDLWDEGQLPQNHCLTCHSREIQPLNVITHSISLRQLKYIFAEVLPRAWHLYPQDTPHNQTIQTSLAPASPHVAFPCLVDVGSRTGAVLYAGYVYSSITRLVGVEINPYFCQVQQDTVTHFRMGDRIEVIQDDIRNQAALLREASVVMLHNVFDFWLADPAEHQRCWEFLRGNLSRSGQFILCIPGLERTLRNAEVSLEDIQSWVEEIELPRYASSKEAREGPESHLRYGYGAPYHENESDDEVEDPDAYSAPCNKCKCKHAHGGCPTEEEEDEDELARIHLYRVR
eukprot:gnl/Trimastix_PCT/4405.p1 GENE.gnl/Trimastix_PCT/4405~~gnl/Trimastix_PCT/4405.p1  ORF type:complete len:391 (+),score=62.50 gnl/Trimastix_PCT/4405:53-1225(+)